MKLLRPDGADVFLGSLLNREGLCVPARRPRKRIRNAAAPPRELELTADRPNGVWCLDFVEDSTLGGSKLRVLSVTDEFTRESLALEAGHSFRSERVCAVLEALIQRCGAPGALLRMDNGPEFVALAVRGQCHRQGISAAYIAPGKPWQNGFADSRRASKSFRARLRDEFLDAEAFWSVADAQARLGGWRRYWNGERLHSSLDYQTPEEFAARWAAEVSKQAETKAATGA